MTNVGMLGLLIIALPLLLFVVLVLISMAAGEHEIYGEERAISYNWYTGDPDPEAAQYFEDTFTKEDYQLEGKDKWD